MSKWSEWDETDEGRRVWEPEEQPFIYIWADGTPAHFTVTDPKVILEHGLWVIISKIPLIKHSWWERVKVWLRKEGKK